MINEQTIKETFEQCLNHAVKLIPLEKWVHMPASLQIECAKRAYGEVNSKGEIRVSKAFIGTTSINKLKHTILHELAHLIVGVKQNHNKYFKRMEAYLCQGLEVTQSEKKSVLDNNGYKYRLLAYSENQVFDLGGAFRRTKKYTAYSPDAKNYISVEGVRISHFKYVPFQQASH